MVERQLGQPLELGHSRQRDPAVVRSHLFLQEFVAWQAVVAEVVLK